jgi:hypothetical protein
MCMPKYKGGLGFRDIEIFNRALLAHQVWRILTAPKTLSTCIIKAVYFLVTDILSAVVGPRPSHWWKKPLWSQFVRAIDPSCRTGIDYSGPMPLPVLAWTRTDGSPRGRACSEGGDSLVPVRGTNRDRWSLHFGLFLYSGRVLCFIYLFIWCFVFNLIVLHIYKNNEGTTLYIYIYIIHHGHKYIIHRLIRRAWSKHITNGTHTNLI